MVCNVQITKKATFRTCDIGHVHCTRCGRIARRFRKGLTCGFGCKPPKE